jgi:hypothetical protein
MLFVSSSWNRRMACASAIAAAVAFLGSPATPAGAQQQTPPPAQQGARGQGAPTGLPAGRGQGQGRGYDAEADLQRQAQTDATWRAASPGKRRPLPE